MLGFAIFGTKEIIVYVVVIVVLVAGFFYMRAARALTAGRASGRGTS